ncbi:CybS-domain-containing protein [Phycomyces blakesleeanus]
MAFRFLVKPVGIQVSRPQIYRASAWSASVGRKPYSGTAPASTSSTTTPVVSSTATTTTPASTQSPTSEKKDEAIVSSEEKKEKSDDDKKVVDKRDSKEYTSGAFHWNLERASSVVLIPLISTQLVFGAFPVVDGLLGVVLPFHIHLGLESCITDYIPKRVYPRLNKAANWTLFGSTGLVMWGCYEFNTNDVGLTEFAQRIWGA